MGKYLSLQLKRALKIFPFVLCVVLVIAVCFSVIVLALQKNSKSSDKNRKFKVAITGDTDDEYTRMGLYALKNLDNSRFAMEIIELPEKEAHDKLMNGEIAAYVILPENFIDRAISGDIDTATYVTSAGAKNIVTMFKNEMTAMITDIVVYNQKAIYALRRVLERNNIKSSHGDHINNLTMDFVGLILGRSKICTIESLGISQGTNTLEYYACSISIIILMIIGVAFVTIHIKKDNSLDRLLVSKGHKTTMQVFCEYLTHFVSMILVLGLFAALLLLAPLIIKMPKDLEASSILPLILRLVPVVVMICSLNMLVFEISGSVINAVLLHFFGSIAGCYICGCIYPVYALPDNLQKIAPYLPWGVSREYLEGAFVRKNDLAELIGILAFACLFFILTVAIRKRRLSSNKG